MVQSILLKILLFPFSLIYGFFSILFNALYDLKILDPVSFNIPVINIGNLTVGGSGKTPHTEYLIRLLKPYLEVAVLSRGYKRKTKGFKAVELNDTVLTVGDEPLLYKRKYPDTGVFVDESRSEGIPFILMRQNQTQVILLDDAYQHRAVKPGLNMLLTTYDKPFFSDFFLPTGTLREWRSSYQRADIIVITKCPFQLTEQDRENMLRKINPLPHQRVYFSYYRYYRPYYIYNPSITMDLDESMDVLLVSGIASSAYMAQYVADMVHSLEVMDFTDHHMFTFDDLIGIKTHYDSLDPAKKMILTTEKDATRLDIHRSFILENKLPVYLLPVDIDFHFQEKNAFEEDIKNYLLNFKV
jgi:tetraacyldisaccharide 4'-kinase